MIYQRRQDGIRRKAAEAARQCVRVLKEKFGAREAFIFGSLRGDSPWHDRSDIDIAVEGLPPGQYVEALATLYELLPQGVELDLVPLERAVPSLVALARGETKMPKDPIEALTVEVQNESASLARIVEEASRDLVRLSEPPSELEISGMGKYLHDFYEGVERIFERIEKRLKVALPSSENWYALLLQQMEHEVPQRRPAITGHALALRLHRYLRFRHLFRHTYGYELVWNEMQPLVEGLPEVFAKFRTSVERFLTKVKAVRTRTAKRKSGKAGKSRGAKGRE